MTKAESRPRGGTLKTVQAAPPLFILVMLMASGPFGSDIVVPALPGMADYFSVEYATIQLVVTFYFLAQTSGQLIYGPLSDRFGRRPLMMGGLSIFVISTIAAVLAPNIWVLLLARIGQALGGSAATTLTRAVVRDVYDPQHAASALGHLAVATVGIPALVPWLGGVISESYGWRAIFLVLLVVGGLGLTAAVWRLRETNLNPIDETNLVGILRIYRGLLKEKVFIGYTGFVAFHSGSYITFATVAPIVIETLLHVRPGVYARFYIITALGYLIGSIIAGKLTVRLGLQIMMRFSIVASIIGLVVFSGLVLLGVLNLWSLFGTMTFICMGFGLGAPSAMTGAINVKPRVAGSASGLMGAIQASTGAIVALITSYVFTGESAVPFVLMISGSIAVACLFYGLVIMASRQEVMEGA